MRRLGLACLLLTGCFDFEGALRGRCSDGGFTEGGTGCDRFRDAGSGGGSGGGGGGGGAGGGGGGAVVVWSGDGGRICTEDDWCWENPGGPGGADLFVLFGTTDSDVWAAGAGGTLVHWNGSRWEQARSLLPMPALMDLEPEPAFRTSLVTDAGEVWLSGERAPIFQRSDSPAFVTGGVYGFNVLASWKGRAFGVNGRFTDFNDLTATYPLLNYDRFNSMLVNDEACFVTVDRGGASGGPFRGVVDCRTDVHLLDTGADGGSEQALALFSFADGGVGVTGRHANVFLRDGGAWAEVPLNGYDSNMRDNYGALNASTQVGREVWLAGELGAVIKLDPAQMSSTPIRAPNFNNATLSTAWTSRDGTFWAAGSGGAVVRIDAGTTFVSSAASVVAYGVVDLWADPLQQVAVLANSDLMIRNVDAGTWTRKTTTSPTNWVAGIGAGADMFLLGSDGQLYRLALSTNTPQLVAPFLDGGIRVEGARSAAFAPAGTELFLVGAAGTVGLLNGHDGGFVSLIGNDSPNGPARIVGVARLADGGTLVAGNEGTFGSELGGLYEIADGGWSKVRAFDAAIEQMARCQDSSVLVVGQHELSGRYQDGSWSPFRAQSSVLPVFNAAWCDSTNRAWILSETGKVFRYATDLSETVELTGWGASAGDRFQANVITGNLSTVFIGGGKTAILSKKLQP